MPDYISDFVSQKNLLDMGRGVSPFFAPVDETLLNSGVAPQQLPMQPIGMDEFIPPVPQHPNFNNVVVLPHKPDFSNVVSDAPQNNGHPKNLRALITRLEKQKESSNDYQAVNPHSSASGAYQYLDSTWNNYGGYTRAALAPPAVQDRRFAQDIANRLTKFGGDPYKTIAAHYLPALADDPSKWMEPFKVHGKTVKPVIDYVRYVVNGSPLEKGLDEYLAQQNG